MKGVKLVTLSAFNKLFIFFPPNILAPALFLQLRTNLGSDMPIFILEGHTYANAWILPIVKQDQDAKRASQYQAFLIAPNTKILTFTM